MKVSEQMQKDPATVTPDATVSEVARLMTERSIMHVVVVNSDQEPVGMITAGDLIAKHARLHFPTYFSLLGFSFPVESRRDEHEIKQALAATAGELMETAIVVIAPDADVDDAASFMLDNEVSCLAVVEDGKLAGTIDESDIVRLLVLEETS